MGRRRNGKISPMNCPHCGKKQKPGASECPACQTVFVGWLKNNARKKGLLDHDRPPKKSQIAGLPDAARLALIFVSVFAVFHGSLWWLSSGRRQSRREEITAPFKGRMAGLAAYTKIAPPGAQRPDCRGGKFVALNEKTGGLDDLHFELPDGMRAETPEQATVLVRVRRGWRSYGRRPDGVEVFQATAEVSVYHLRDGKVTDGPMKVLGPPPKLDDSPDSEEGGEPPVQVILTNLRAFCS